MDILSPSRWWWRFLLQAALPPLPLRLATRESCCPSPRVARRRGRTGVDTGWRSGAMLTVGVVISSASFWKSWGVRGDLSGREIRLGKPGAVMLFAISVFGFLYATRPPQRRLGATPHH